MLLVAFILMIIQLIETQTAEAPIEMRHSEVIATYDTNVNRAILV
jgi:hypothetical protein